MKNDGDKKPEKGTTNLDDNDNNNNNNNNIAHPKRTD